MTDVRVTPDLMAEELIKALDRNFTSPNVSDSNFEAANLVDTTNNIAKALWAIAHQLERQNDLRADEQVS